MDSFASAGVEYVKKALLNSMFLRVKTFQRLPLSIVDLNTDNSAEFRERVLKCFLVQIITSDQQRATIVRINKKVRIRFLTRRKFIRKFCLQILEL